MTQVTPIAADQEMASDALIERLQWRYAAKKMDPAKSVPQDKVERILEAARLAPTSSGLQPYEIFVVTNKEVRAHPTHCLEPEPDHRRLAPVGVCRLGQLHGGTHQHDV